MVTILGFEIPGLRSLYVNVCRLSVLVPTVTETETHDDDQTRLVQHVNASLCIHWSLVFIPSIRAGND